MGVRYRERVVEVPTAGTYTWGQPPQSTQTQKPNYDPSQTCLDTVGRRDQDNPFNLYSVYSGVPGLFGQNVFGGVIYREVDNWPIDHCNDSVDPRIYYAALSPAQISNFAWDTVSKTNPSRSSVNIPTMIGELKDVPMLVKGWGHGILTKIASGNLWWQFGIRPMISDIRKLIQFTKEVNNLIRAMKKLRDEGSITRRCILDSAQTGPIKTFDGMLSSSCSYYLTGQRHVTHGYKTWGSCRWKPASDFELPYDSPQLEAELKRVVLGLSVEGAASTVWELIPWSWLVDWFVNVQNFLGTINAIPLEQEGICIMRTCTVKSAYTLDAEQTLLPLFYNTNCHQDGKYFELGIRKERYPTILTGVPTASIPALSAGQWSILGSLAVLKRMPLARRR